jgi:hypothetical protein
VRAAPRTFTNYRLQSSQPIAVARITQLQLQQLQHLQHLQRFADLHLGYLQPFWQIIAYMPSFWHKIAMLPLPPFMPIGSSGVDDICDKCSILLYGNNRPANSYLLFYQL